MSCIATHLHMLQDHLQLRSYSVLFFNVPAMVSSVLYQVFIIIH
jgi:hypothetical protein